jgi:sugar/nucleoside kinase (ribokinase family)
MKTKKSLSIVCIGSVCQDIFFPTEAGIKISTPEDLLAQEKIAFELGAKYKVEERHESIGGCAGNVASGLAKLGVETACYSSIGGDALGKWIKKALEKNKVEVKLIAQEKKAVSDLSAIIVDKKSGERIIFSNQKANGQLKIKEEKIKDFAWFFVGDLHGNWEENLDKIIQIAQAHKIKIAYNPRQSNIHDNPHKIIQSIAFADILFLNKDEAMELVAVLDKTLSKKELTDENFLLDKMREMGAGIAVITDGVRGAWAKSETEVCFLAGQKVAAVDSTGAGDAFSSGFLAAQLKKENLEESVRWGIANSAHEVQFYGSIQGLLNEEAIKKYESA